MGNEQALHLADGNDNGPEHRYTKKGTYFYLKMVNLMGIRLLSFFVVFVGFTPWFVEGSLAQSTESVEIPFKISSRTSFTNIHSDHEKCATPLILHYLHQHEDASLESGHAVRIYNDREIQLEELPAGAIKRLKESDSSTSAQKTLMDYSFTSPNGKFILHYDLTGADAVDSTDTDSSGVPDYIEKAALSAEYSLKVMVDELGYSDPIPSSGTYDIYFEDFGFYGYTIESSNGTDIYLHSTYEGFPKNDHPEGDQFGALYVTIAHELKHAIQYVANEWQGEAGSFKWIEMDATMMEEVVYDEVNDYYNYLYGGSIFTDPDEATPGAYSHVTWSLFFSERFGQNFWVGVWDQFSVQPELAYIDAVRRQLELESTSFEEEHLRNHLWHMTSGDQLGDIGFGFEERLFYPNATIAEEYYALPDSALTLTSLDKHAARYILIEPEPGQAGVLEVTLTSENPGLGAALGGWFKNGQTKEIIIPPSKTQSLLEVITDWPLADLEKVALVIGSFSDFIGTSTAALTGYIPDQYSLSQNYPNPFNPLTTIRFELASTEPVTLEIFDATGRLVSTLVNRPLSAGVHRAEFDGRNSASGIYFYRLTTPSFSETRSMVLVK